MNDYFQKACSNIPTLIDLFKKELLSISKVNKVKIDVRVQVPNEKTGVYVGYSFGVVLTGSSLENDNLIWANVEEIQSFKKVIIKKMREAGFEKDDIWGGIEITNNNELISKLYFESLLSGKANE